MRVDVTDLDAFAQLGEQSAVGTSNALETLTSGASTVVVRRVSITTRGTLRDRLAAGHRCVRISLQGGVVGDAFLGFKPEAASTFLDALPPRSADDDTALLQIGKGVVSHVLDTVTDQSGLDITISPPRYTSLEALSGDELPYLLDCRLDIPELDAPFDLFLRLTGGTFDRLLAGTGTSSIQTVPANPAPVSVTQLGEFAQTIAAGIDRGGMHTSKMTGLDLEARPNGLRFLTRSEIQERISGTDQLRAGLTLSDPPGGFVLVGVEGPSGSQLGERMLPLEKSEAGLGGRSRETILDLVTHLTGEVLEGWSPLFNGEIDHAPPEPLRADEPFLDPFMDWLDTDRRYGFLVEITLATLRETVTCDIFAMPDEFPLLAALDHDRDSEPIVELSRH